MALSSIREILVKVVTTGSSDLRALQKEMSKVNQSMESFKNTATGMGITLGSLFAGIGIDSLRQMSDEMTLVNDRMKIFVPEGESTTEIFNKMAIAANAVRSPLADFGTIFNRLALATKNIGISSEAALTATTALMQTFRIAGSTAAEAASGSIQFSQAMSYGTLRSQELRSVMQSNTYFANELTKRFEKNGESLFKMAEAGRITTKEVLLLLADLIPQINRDAAKLSQTFEQTLIVAMNQVRLKIKEINE